MTEGFDYDTALIDVEAQMMEVAKAVVVDHAIEPTAVVVCTVGEIPVISPVVFLDYGRVQHALHQAVVENEGFGFVLIVDGFANVETLRLDALLVVRLSRGRNGAAHAHPYRRTGPGAIEWFPVLDAGQEMLDYYFERVFKTATRSPSRVN